MLELLGIEWHWVQNARQTRVDPAVDIYGCSPDDYAWDIPNRSRTIFLDRDGRLSTIYLGSKHSDQVVVYDKARQKKLAPEFQRTRIEFRGRQPGLVKDLRTLACPFSRLLVFTPNPTGHLAVSAPVRAAMKTVGQAKGMEELLSLFDPGYRTKLRKILEASTPEWCRPEEIWKQWYSVVTATLPGLFDANPEAEKLLASYAKFGVNGLHGNPDPS